LQRRRFNILVNIDFGSTLILSTFLPVRMFSQPQLDASL
jgi:hypothetical protein